MPPDIKLKSRPGQIESMEPKNIERITALSFLLIGTFLLLFGLSLLGIVQIPLFGIVILIAGIFSVLAALLLFADSRSQ